MNMQSEDLIYGRWPVKEALEAGRVLKVLLAEGAHGEPVDDVVRLAKEKKVPFHWVEKRKLDQMVGERHQGIVAQAAPIRFMELEALFRLAENSPTKGPRLLFLDGILDPQNLGSILRSAYFFGVPGVVIPKWRAASLSGGVVRASAGAAALIPVAQVSNLATAMESARKKGLWLVGADMDGTDAKVADVPRPFALVLGSEGEGLHHLVKTKCDMLLNLKRKAESSGIQSLNVSAACAALLHQLS